MSSGSIKMSVERRSTWHSRSGCVPRFGLVEPVLSMSDSGQLGRPSRVRVGRPDFFLMERSEIFLPPIVTFPGMMSSKMVSKGEQQSEGEPVEQLLLAQSGP